jgi:uncharacterized delta-60 repeat protein
MGLVRYTANGELDPTFGAAGTVTINVPGNDVPSVLLLQPNGRILLGGIAGRGRKTVPNETILLRFNSNGTPDSTFGSKPVLFWRGSIPAGRLIRVPATAGSGQRCCPVTPGYLVKCPSHFVTN